MKTLTEIFIGFIIGLLIASAFIHEIEIQELQDQIKSITVIDSTQTDCHEITLRILKEMQQAAE